MPLYVPIEETIFITVVMNILRQTMLMTSHSGTGVITILVDVAANMQRLYVDFIASEFATRRETNVAIKNLIIQKDTCAIAKVEQVEPYLKVAKIIANKMGWTLDFDFH